MWKEPDGWTVLSVLITLVLLGMIVTLGIPWIRRTLTDVQQMRYTHQWMTDVVAVQADALRTGRRHGLVAERRHHAGRMVWGYRICMDGNGITRADRVAGRDPCGPFRPLEHPPNVEVVGRVAARPAGPRWGARRMIVCNPWGICSSATTCWTAWNTDRPQCITWMGHLGQWK